MAWSATIQTVTRNATDGSVDIAVRVSNGTLNWDRTFHYEEDNLQMTLPNIREQIRAMFINKAEFLSSYMEIKAKEGTVLL